MTDPVRVPTSPPSQERLERYVLGLLGDEEREALEAQAFSDAGVTTAIDEAETDLVDCWLEGRLQEPARKAFARALQHRPRLRARVDEARALRRGPGGSGLLDTGGRRAAPRLRLTWLVGLGAAAAVLVSVAAWLAQRPAPGTGDPTQAPTSVARRESAQGPAGSPGTATPSASRDPSPPEGRAPASPGSSSPPPRRVVFAVRLPAGTTRASAVTPVRVPAAATHVELRLPVAEGDDYPRYAISVTDATGRVVGAAARASLRPDRTVSLLLTRNTLRDGLHAVTLGGRTDGAPEETLAVVQVDVMTVEP